MSFNKKFFTTGGIVASTQSAPAGLDPLQNFETVTYTGNGSTQKITGYIRKGAAFNGSSSNIDIGGNIVNGLTKLSVSLWVFWDGTNSASDDYFIALGKANSGKIFSADITNNSGIIGFYDGAVVFNSSSAVPQNTWTHIVITADATVAKIYLNGNLDSTHTISSLNFDSSGNAGFIGSWISGTDYEFDGKIDQVRIFDRALDEITDGEVTTLYGETYASSTKSTTDIFNDGSGVALYELDEDANDTGGTYNGTPTNVNFLGMAFQPDFVWVKNRDDNGMSFVLQDTIRGEGQSKTLDSTGTSYEGQYGAYGYISSFDTNGFEVVDGLGNHTNTSGKGYVAWCWKAGGAAVSNTDGSITSTVSANPDAGFSIVSYTGNQAVSTIGHGLSSAPEMIIAKSRSSAREWIVGSDAIGWDKYLWLNSTNAQASSASAWNNTSPTESVFTIGTSALINTTENYIAYCFHSVNGYQKVGSYLGNNTTNVVTTGFQPRFLLIKASSHASSWYIVDSTRIDDNFLSPDLSAAEYTDAGKINFTSTGFTLTSTSYNNAGYTWIYLAIA